MTLQDKIISMADETAKKLNEIPEDLAHTSEIAKASGKLEALNELIKFMLGVR